MSRLRPTWTGRDPRPDDHIDFTGTALESLIGATIAEALAEMPFLAQELEIERRRKGLAGPRFVSRQAVIGDDVYLGSGCTVHEFSTVRSGSIIEAGAVVGFGNEIVQSYVGRNAKIAHKNTVTWSIIGSDVHLAAGVTIGSVTFRNPDGLDTGDPIRIRMPDGSVYNTGTPKFGAVIGDHTRVSMHAALGPGVIVGRDSIIGSGVRLPSNLYPPNLRIRDVHQESIVPWDGTASDLDRGADGSLGTNPIYLASPPTRTRASDEIGWN